MKPVSISDLQLCFFFMHTLSFKTVSYIMICESLRQLKYIRAFKCTFKVIILLLLFCGGNSKRLLSKAQYWFPSLSFWLLKSSSPSSLVNFSDKC